ncbi:hypothetical protein MHK_010371 [Candidatus Magnetomorum sp. HK-1]|nr:hypothetical protein MHK_010371 [Candidatus Magnetomorum sp. HK-1]
MRGSPVKQVQDLFHQSGINQIGTSKHLAKETVREKLAQENQSTTWQMGHVRGDITEHYLK